MSTAEAQREARPPVEADPRPDQSPRRDPLRLNFAANIAGQGVYLITGFILPRLIFDRVGATLLGVWDFGWSMTAHFMLVGAGMMSTVNREVAFCTQSADWDRLRQLVSTCFALFCGCAAVLLGVIVAAAWGLSALLPGLTAAELATARWVVVLLGLSIVVRFPAHVLNGIITGNERYVVHNAILVGTHLATVLTAIGLLLAGFGLAPIAAAYLGGELLAAGLKYAYARRICRQWRIRPRYVSRAMVRYVFGFGIKTFAGSLAQTVLYQTSTVLVGRFLGAEMLAVFARCRSLTLTLDRFLRRGALVFTPRASRLAAGADREALRRLILRATDYSLLLAVPGVLMLVIFGDTLLRIWMGPKFVAPLVLGILAAGHLIPMTQRASYQVLMGLAAHGRAALALVAAAVVSIALGLLLLGPLKAGLVGAALAVVIPVNLAYGVAIPALACRHVGLPVTALWLRLAGRTTLLGLGFGIPLLLVRMLVPWHGWLRLILAGGICGLGMVVTLQLMRRLDAAGSSRAAAPPAGACER